MSTLGPGMHEATGQRMMEAAIERVQEDPPDLPPEADEAAPRASSRGRRFSPDTNWLIAISAGVLAFGLVWLRRKPAPRDSNVVPETDILPAPSANPLPPLLLATAGVGCGLAAVLAFRRYSDERTHEARAQRGAREGAIRDMRRARAEEQIVVIEEDHARERSGGSAEPPIRERYAYLHEYGHPIWSPLEWRKWATQSELDIEVEGTGGSADTGGGEASADADDGGRDRPIRREPGGSDEPPTDDDDDASLNACHWLEDDAGGALPLSSVLRNAAYYWYCFSIQKKCIPEASTSSFPCDEELNAATQAVLHLEVDCSLLDTGFQRRRVRYFPRTGIDREKFDFVAKSGEYPLTLRVIFCNRVIYSEQWILKASIVAGDSASLPAAPPANPRPNASSSRLRPLGAPMRHPYRLTVLTNRFEIVDPYMSPVGGAATLDALAFSLQAAPVRTLFKNFATANGALDQQDPAVIRTFLREVARWGRKVYDLLFDDANSQMRDAVAKIPPGSLLAVHAVSSFPWELIFMGDVPVPDADFLSDTKQFADFLDGFWGVRFNVDVVTGYRVNRFGRSDQLPNHPKTVVLGALNPTAYGPIAEQNRALLLGLEKEYGHAAVVSEVFERKHGLIDMLQRAVSASAESPHLLYFYCHHRAGGSVNQFGYFDDQASTLYMSGENAEPVSVDDLKDFKLQGFAGRYTPLILLNACGSAQGQDFFPSGYIPYFTGELGAAAVIGTLAEIPARQALWFAEAFLRLWFDGAPAASALRDIRRSWLLEHKNPFALYYTLHGIGSLALERRLVMQ